MTFNDPGEHTSDADQYSSFASYSPYSPNSPNLDDLSNQYNPNDPMRPQPPRAEWSITLRQIIGAVIFIVGAELFTFLVIYVNIRFKLGLTRPILGSGLDWLSWFTVINFCALLAFWVILKRLGFFPRMPSGARRGDSRWREW